MITIHTDGVCRNNPGKGGWGVVIIKAGEENEFFGGCYEMTTNNRMELLAVIEGLKKIEGKDALEIFSDSTYVVHAVTDGWIKNWAKNGWKRANKKKVKNRDLWEQLLSYDDILLQKFRWVKGHAGNEHNERCDLLANKGIDELELVDDGGGVSLKKFRF